MNLIMCDARMQQSRAIKKAGYMCMCCFGSLMDLR